MHRAGLLMMAVLSLSAQQPHELINATLWSQTAVEHDAISLQAYRQASAMLDRAWKDKKWTAAVEQTGNFSKLPRAVILDIDETVLDNSAYEARRVIANDDFEPESWSAWVREAKAPPLPGALEFVREAHSRGAKIFYVTNRESFLEEATVRNLAAAGFPATAETVLCKGERPDWTSDKGSRRKEVASLHRILLLIGDDYGDFLSGAQQPLEQRRATAAPYAANWGVKWIALPNPMYGSWEGALAGFERISRTERINRKWKALDPK